MTDYTSIILHQQYSHKCSVYIHRELSWKVGYIRAYLRNLLPWKAGYIRAYLRNLLRTYLTTIAPYTIVAYTESRCILIE